MSKYESIQCIMPENLYEDFLALCKKEGLDAGIVHCLSSNIKNFIGINYEASNLKEFIHIFKKVITMFVQKHKVNVETPHGTKVDLDGYNCEEAIKILQTIIVTHDAGQTASTSRSSPDGKPDAKHQ